MKLGNTVDRQEIPDILNLSFGLWVGLNGFAEERFAAVGIDLVVCIFLRATLLPHFENNIDVDQQKHSKAIYQILVLTMIQKKQLFLYSKVIFLQILVIYPCMEYEDKYAIFIECSDSVKSKGHYWGVVGSLIKNKQIDRFYLWNHNVREVTRDDVKYNQEFLKGWGKPDTSAVARKIVQEKIASVILVTATEVDSNMVSKTDDVFEAVKKNFQIQSSICYIVSDHYVNLSSICPFIRYGDCYLYDKFKGSEIRLLAHHQQIDKVNLNFLNYINLTNFQAKVAPLEQFIISQNMGRAGFPLMKEALLILKKRLVHELSVKQGEEDYSKMIRLSLEDGNTQSALQYAQKMTYEYMSYEYALELQQKIGYLVTLCGNLTSSFDVNQIQSNKMKNAVQVKEGQIDKTVEISKITQNIIECPIIMDEDVPQILVDYDDEPVLQGFDHKIVDDIAACPLRMLNYPEVRAKLKARISHFIGTKLNGKIFINPFTRNKILGAIPLGCHKSHVEVGDSTLAQLISGGKYLGNLNLYYAVVWYLINEGQIEYLKPIKENASEHLAYRLRNSHTTASMCGLPQFVTTRVTTDVAIWYIVNSGYFNLPTNRDVFRYHIFNMEPMVKILRVLKYPLHKGVKEHFFRTRAMLKMLFKLKKYNPNFQKGFHTIFKGFYQKGFFVDITNVSIDFWQREVCAMFIPVDGQADDDQIKRIREIIPKCCKYLSNEQIYFLAQSLDVSKSASDIFLDYNVKIPPLPKAEINWCYGLKNFEVKTKVCPATMRPYLKVHGKSWQSLARQAYEVQDVSELFSGHKYFARFVGKYKRLPISFDELSIYYYNRFIHSGKQRTLPYLTQKWSHEFMQTYQKICSNQPKAIKDLVFLFNLQHIDSIRSFEESWTNRQE